MTKSKETNVIQTTQMPVDSDKLHTLGEYIESLETTEGALIGILHKAQEIFGYLPRDVQLYISRKLNISGAEVFGVASFYSYFSMKPGGKHTVSVCMGTACFVRGADKIIERVKEKLGIESNETTKDGLFTLKDVRCVGACGLAPIVMMDDKVFGRVTEDEIDNILKPYYGEESNGD